MPPLPDPRLILVVDDDPDIRSVLGVALGELGGLRAVFAADGAGARATLVNHTPDLVVMDLHLGAEDGRAVWRDLLRSAPTDTAPRVVFLSAVSGPEAEDLKAEPHCLGLLTKPFDFITVADSLRALWSAGA